MSRFVGLSLMCLVFMSTQARDHDQYSGNSWMFQLYQDGDGEGQFQSENQEFDETGITKHNRVKGDIKDGVCKVTSREDLHNSARETRFFPFFFECKENQERDHGRDFHSIGENSKWIYPLARHQKPANSTESNLMKRSKVMFGNLFKSKKRKCKEERDFRKSSKIRMPFGSHFKKDHKPLVRHHHSQGMEPRFDPYPTKELIRMHQDMQQQMKELRKQNEILMKRMQNFEKYFFGDYSED